MRRFKTALWSWIGCGVLAAFAAGCGDPYDKPVPGESPSASPASADSTAAESPGSLRVESAEAPRAVIPGQTAADAKADQEKRRPAAQEKASQTRPPQPAGPSIRLSAGTALAQSLPTGTAMGFSVDYRFAGAGPDATAEYFWVIEPAKGQPLRQPVSLNAEGTLQGFFPQLRPENGPFQCHVEDGLGNRLSPSIALR